MIEIDGVDAENKSRHKNRKIGLNFITECKSLGCDPVFMSSKCYP